MSEYVKAKLSPYALGIALGILKGACLMFFAWMSFYSGYGAPMVDHIASFCHGYAASFVGGLIGGVWGFFIGFVSGIIVGMVYNFCLRCSRC